MRRKLIFEVKNYFSSHENCSIFDIANGFSVSRIQKKEEKCSLSYVILINKLREDTHGDEC